MGSSQKPTIPKAGNTQELKRLEKLLEEMTTLKDNILADKKRFEDKCGKLVAENLALKKSNEEAVKKILTLETASEGGTAEQTMPGGYVEIASLPFSGKRPPEITVNGIQVPRRIDADGVIYEIVPKQTALSLMSDGSAFKRYLVGPCEKIEGTVPNGLYPKRVCYDRHSKRKGASGQVEFIRVIIEESRD